MNVELGRYVHAGRKLLADNVQISQRTTLPPTPFPTFSPTKGQDSGPTNQPTIKTDAPTTTNVITCPEAGSLPLLLSAGDVMLEVADTSLCTLTKYAIIPRTGDTVTLPIARSYNGNPWEKSAGEFAASMFHGNDIVCYGAGCQLSLPPLEEGEEYRLTGLNHTLSEINEYARFLETATFGVTEQQLDEINTPSRSVKGDIVYWISQQMNSTLTPITSHREFWRRGLNARVRH